MQGYWNTRDWRSQAGATIAANYRGNDYFHSSFLDLVINGLIGLDAVNRSADGTHLTLTLEPLLPASAKIAFFCLDGIRTAAHDVAAIWDESGSKYGKGKGLMLLVDGTVVAHSSTLSKLQVTILDGPLSPALPQPPSPFPPTPPPPPPAPPLPPVPGWTLLSNLTGSFCCDGKPRCAVKLLPDITDHACRAKCLATPGCQYVTTTAIPNKPPGCFIATSCAEQGKYIDTPSPSDINTWRHQP